MIVTASRDAAMAKARKRVEDRPIGPILERNLHRLGHADIQVRVSKLSDLIKKRTGFTMSRQRLSAIMNAVRVEPETIEVIAKAIGVSPDELTRDDEW